MQGLKEILSSQGNRFQNLADLTVIEMVSICIRKEKGKSFGITPKALDNLKTEELEQNWDSCQKTIFETIRFLSDMKIHGPGILPYVYLVLPLCYHFHNNNSPNRVYAKQWFWRTTFGVEDYRRADEVYDYCSD
ncbi:hypothetical protein ACFLV0_07465, partial [Chloroflexota bacterium]